MLRLGAQIVGLERGLKLPQGWIDYRAVVIFHPQPPGDPLAFWERMPPLLATTGLAIRGGLRRPYCSNLTHTITTNPITVTNWLLSGIPEFPVVEGE